MYILPICVYIVDGHLLSRSSHGLPSVRISVLISFSYKKYKKHQ